MYAGTSTERVGCDGAGRAGWPRPRGRIWLLLWLTLATTACGEVLLAPEQEEEEQEQEEEQEEEQEQEGPDTDDPYPLDMGGVMTGAPVTYKELPLALTDNGEPSIEAVDGVIGVACVGMSNGWQECGALIAGLDGGWDADVNPEVVVVNCAMGGAAIESWNDPANDANLWDACLTARVSEAGIRADQIRVIYHKAANQWTTGTDGNVLPPYPDASSDYFNFRTNLSTFASRVSVEIPSVQAVYTSTRSYGGYSPWPERGEPLSYEEGHALNGWLDENPEVDGVWYGWGAYIWARDCAVGPANATGLCYVREDFSDDGVHPSVGGAAKIGEVIHEHFLTQPWYQR